MFRRPIYLLLILFFALVIRLMFFDGFIGGPDAFLYAHMAHSIFDGTFSIADIKDVYEYRFLVTFPTALSYRVFGISDIVTVIWPLLCSLCTIILVFFLGRHLFGDKTALLAAFLFSFFPLEITFATRLLPDVILTFFVSLSILIFLTVEKEKKRKTRLVKLFFTGMLIASCFLIKESAAALLISFIIYCVLKREYRQPLFIILAGGTFFFVCYWLFLYVKTGDFLFQIRTTANVVSGVVEHTPDYFVRGHDLLVYPKGIFGFNLYGLASFGVFYYFISIALLVILLKKERKAYILIFWILSFFLFLQFGTYSLKRYFMPKCFHYLSVITVPGVLAVAFFLNNYISDRGMKLLKGIFARYAKLVIILFLLLTSLYGAYRMKLYSQSHEVKYKGAWGYLKTRPEKKIYCMNMDWVWRLDYYSGFQIGYDYQDIMPPFLTLLDEQDEHRLVRNVTKVSEYRKITDAYIIIDDVNFFLWDPDGNKVGSNKDIPEFLISPPVEWELLYKKNGVSVYLAPPSYGADRFVS